MNGIIIHKIKGKGTEGHACKDASRCHFCTTDKHLVDWTYQNCGACHKNIDCLFMEGTMATHVEPSKLSLTLATTFLAEMDPEGKLGLSPDLDMTTFSAPKDGENIVCRDLFEECPVAGAFLLCRDAMRKMVTLDEDGEPAMSYENTFWIESSGRWRDAAFNVAMGRWSAVYMGKETIGASFRLIDGKIGVAFRPASDIDKAKMLLAKAILKQAGEKKGRGDPAEALKELLGGLLQ